ncbi:TAXI family TRAP transporter solute-binding subunit [Amycolatopsis sp. RM579]|uniref:TAXI family TRAP transporter solute-binding subunit n=1 Tax=Amycolatopsis pithecellobii TaxID=664692 RepID=A0A6N7Z5G5_9PSEU|nr:TAXI family TRAP transporter solute-binding subunit [Amycolatopsis pithecellobii]
MLSRRAALTAAGLLLLAGCTPRFDGARVTITTGSAGAVYNQLGAALSAAWAAGLGVSSAVETSAGSGQNLDRLLAGQADVGISAADAAALRATAPDGGRLRALARLHDDYIQVVVHARTSVKSLADLRGKRVSVGLADSGVLLITDRLLAAAGLSGERDLDRRRLSVDDAVKALATEQIDAFFWSGGLPTEQVAELAQQVPIRLIDLADTLPALAKNFDVYETASMPASVYGLSAPVTTLLVPNFLLVTDRMPDRLAQSLTQGVFDAQTALAAASPAARSVDVRSGIETVPIPLHPGARAYYRAAHYVSD